MMSRKTLLYLLLAATVLYRASFFFETLSKLSVNPGMQWEPKNGRLVVQSVMEADPFGRKTLAARAGIRPGDRILQFETEKGTILPMRNLVQFSDALRAVREHPDFTIVVEREAQAGTTAQLRLPVHRAAEPWNWKEFLVAQVWTFFLPLVAIVTGFFIGFSKPEDDHAFLACLLFVSMSAIVTVSAYLLPPGWREFSRIYETTCNVFLPYLFMRFFLLFPSPSWIDRKAPWLKKLLLGFTILLWIAYLIVGYALYYSLELLESIQIYMKPVGVGFSVIYVSMLLIGVCSLILNTFRKQSADEKRKMIILLAGVVAGFLVPAALCVVLLTTKNNSLWLISAIALTLAAFPASFAYVVVRHRVLGIRFILRRGLQYLFISRGFWVAESIIIFLLLYFLARPILIRMLPVAPPLLLTFLIGATTLVLFSTLRRINEPVMRAIDRRFFRQAYDAHEILTELSEAVGRHAANPAELLRLITNRITRSLCPDRVAIFLKGYDIVDDETAGERRLHRMKTDQYFCVWIQHGDRDDPPQLSQHAFPENAYVPPYIESLESSEALDVYIEDPRSWAHALVKANGSQEHWIQEREMLMGVGTRLVLPLRVGDRTSGFLSLGEKLSEEPYSKEDKNLLMNVAQQAAVALDYSKLISQVAEQEKMKREMEIARQVQAQLFPQSFPSVVGLDYTGYCRAARGVGGDYFDFLNLRESLLGIALADISGKGISAALLMAGLQALLRSNAPAHEKSLERLFPAINKLMCSSTAPGKYATFFYTVYDSEKRTLDYVNAGHLPPMIFRANGEILRLRTGGTVVGMLPDAAYRKDQVQLQQGDVLVIYSDGVSEAMNSLDEEFGEDRLMQIVQPHLHRPAAEIAQAVLSGVESFVAGAVQNDDITLVVARVV